MGRFTAALDETFFAPTTSAFSSNPHATQQNSL
jgi:uncharacterized surface protein with fasciclin (FAS1) repeats